MNSAEARRRAVARMVEILEGVEYSGTSKFEDVIVGEPASLPLQSPAGAVACLWFLGESEKTQTLGNVMVTQDWRVRMYWNLQPTPAGREDIEVQMWDACRLVQEAFSADRRLTYEGEDTITDLAITLVRAEYGTTPAADGSEVTRYRTLTFDLQLQEFEAEAIHA